MRSRLMERSEERQGPLRKDGRREGWKREAVGVERGEHCLNGISTALIIHSFDQIKRITQISRIK